jgi:hypothetical protein
LIFARRAFGVLARPQRAFPGGIVFLRVLEHFVETCIASGEGVAVDASLITADANKQRSIAGSGLAQGSRSDEVKQFLLAGPTRATSVRCPIRGSF